MDIPVMDTDYVLPILPDERIGRYTLLWGRSPDASLSIPGSVPAGLEVFRFPVVPGDDVPYGERYVYMTSGMSDLRMDLPEGSGSPERVELSILSRNLVQDDHGRDFILGLLHSLANYPFLGGKPYRPGSVVEFGRPIVPGSEMTSLLLIPSPLAPMEDLSFATVRAGVVYHVFPIGDGELSFAVQHGVPALLDELFARRIDPSFDLDRIPFVR